MTIPTFVATINSNTQHQTIERRCDSMEDQDSISSFQSYDENVPNKRIKSSHCQGGQSQQYREPIRFVAPASSSAYFTFGQQGITAFQRHSWTTDWNNHKMIAIEYNDSVKYKVASPLVFYFQLV